MCDVTIKGHAIIALALLNWCPCAGEMTILMMDTRSPFSADPLTFGVASDAAHSYSQASAMINAQYAAENGHSFVFVLLPCTRKLFGGACAGCAHLTRGPRHPSWCKLLAVWHTFALLSTDIVFWVDSDAIFKSLDESVESLLRLSTKSVLISAGPPNYWSGTLNAGIMLFRRSNNTRSLLADWWEDVGSVSKKNYEHHSWEQQSLIDRHARIHVASIDVVLREAIVGTDRLIDHITWPRFYHREALIRTALIRLRPPVLNRGRFDREVTIAMVANVSPKNPEWISFSSDNASDFAESSAIVFIKHASRSRKRVPVGEPDLRQSVAPFTFGTLALVGSRGSRHAVRWLRILAVKGPVDILEIGGSPPDTNVTDVMCSPKSIRLNVSPHNASSMFYVLDSCRPIHLAACAAFRLVRAFERAVVRASIRCEPILLWFDEVIGAHTDERSAPLLAGSLACMGSRLIDWPTWGIFRVGGLLTHPVEGAACACCTNGCNSKNLRSLDGPLLLSTRAQRPILEALRARVVTWLVHESTSRLRTPDLGCDAMPANFERDLLRQAINALLASKELTEVQLFKKGNYGGMIVPHNEV